MMCSKSNVFLCVVFLLCSTAVASLANNFTSVGFAYNTRLQTSLGSGELYPQGALTLGGVPFYIPTVGNNCWQSHDPYETGSNPRYIDINVNLSGADQVHTLINTGGGQPGPTSYAWIEFWGSNGAYYRKNLVGNVDIRDYNKDGWTNYINGTTTTNVWLINPGIENGEKRLDKQAIKLPSEFLTQTLYRIRLSDNGDSNFQRAFLAGVTIETVPEPSSVLALLCGIGGMVKSMRKKGGNNRNVCN